MGLLRKVRDCFLDPVVDFGGVEAQAAEQMVKARPEVVEESSKNGWLRTRVAQGDGELGGVWRRWCGMGRFHPPRTDGDPEPPPCERKQ